MGHDVKAVVVLDSINPDGERITTFELTYWRGIHAEMCRHKRHARSTASTRAIPLKKQIQMILDHPFSPTRWPVNQSGMSNSEWLTQDDAYAAEAVWMQQMLDAVQAVTRLAESDLNVHKQMAGRLLEPFMHITETLTATHWSNFFAQRCDPGAQPEIQELAWAIKTAMDASTPNELDWGDWHLPWANANDPAEYVREVSVARCASSSYGRQNIPGELQKELDRVEGLAAKNHWSPFEHQAQALAGCKDMSNVAGQFTGTNWAQHRKMYLNESGEYGTP